MDRFTGAWTPALVTAEADRLFPTITIGLMFPSAARPIASSGRRAVTGELRHYAHQLDIGRVLHGPSDHLRSVQRGHHFVNQYLKSVTCRTT